MASYYDIADIVLRGTPEQKAKFSDACESYNKLSRAFERVSRKMSQMSGWRGEGSLDFRDFHRFHIEESQDGLRFFNINQELCHFNIDSEGSAVVDGKWFPFGVDVDEAINKVNYYCLSEDNIKAVREYSYGGCVSLASLEFGDGRLVVCSDMKDAAFLRAVEAYSRKKDVTLEVLGSKDFRTLFNSYYGRGSSFREDTPRPYNVMLLYDGIRIKSQLEGIADVFDRDPDDLMREEAMFREANVYATCVRSEMSAMAGLETDSLGLYTFEHAVYPVLSSVRSIDLVTDAGNRRIGTFNFFDNQITYQRNGFSEPEVMDSLEDVKNLMCSECLSEENISLVRGEFLKAGLVEEVQVAEENKQNQIKL